MRLSRDSKLTYWREIMQEWEASGETQQAFCENKGIKYGNFAKWRQRLKRHSEASGSLDEQKFIPANIVNDASVNNNEALDYILCLKGDVEIKIPTTCPTSQLEIIFGMLGLSR